MRSPGMVVLLSLLGCGLTQEARAETLPDVMVGFKLCIPTVKAPLRIGLEARGGPYFYDWDSGLLGRVGVSTLLDGGTDGFRFGLSAYGGWGYGTDIEPLITVDGEVGFVVGTGKVPKGWLAGGRLEAGYRFRGLVGYQRVMPFDKSKDELGEYVNVVLGGSPIQQHEFIVVGRPLRVQGAPVVAPVLGARFERCTLEGETRLHEAREELAAVSTFIRTAFELGALGAPSELVYRCLQAAREEVRHMIRQLNLSGLEGLAEVQLGVLDPNPRTFATRAEALCTLAAESWFDGWHGERAAVKVLESLRDSARDDATARIWNEIGEEEAGHARLSGDVVDWCVAQGGDIVRASLRAA